MSARDYIDPKRVKQGGLDDIISTGGFGIVTKGTYEDKNGKWQVVALKQPQPERDQVQFLREMQDTLDISRFCKRVVKGFGWTRLGARQTPTLIMKLYTRSLQDLIIKADDGKPRDPDDPSDRLHPHLVVSLAKDVAEGLEELHNANISNEDLKPGNVLLDENNRAFLADFGISKFFGSGCQDSAQFSTVHIRGTSPYLPPEKLSNTRMTYGLKVDMWAFGILVGQLMTVDWLYPYGRGLTWENVRNELVRDKQAPKAPVFHEAPRLQQIVQACFQLEPAQRITSKQAVEELCLVEEEMNAAGCSVKVDNSTSSKDAEMEAMRAQLEAFKLQKEQAEQKHQEEERKRIAAEQREAQLHAEQQQQRADPAAQRPTQGAAAAAVVTPPPDTRALNQQALQDACRMGDATAAKSQIDCGADVNYAELDGYTPLWSACYSGHTVCAKVLVEAGADVNKADKYGWTPLRSACGNGHTECAKVLVEAGADVNKANNGGRTPIYYVNYWKNKECATLLKKHGSIVSCSMQ